MAELDVQPKRKSPWWIWLVAALVLLICIFLFRSCGDNKDISSVTTDITSQPNQTANPDWESVDFNSPVASFEEITDTSISVRGNDKYTIYGLGENILFESGKDEVQGKAKDKLEQISKSVKKRFTSYWVAVYGNTDATGDANLNRELSARRAESVKNWLIEYAEMPNDKISVGAMGEKDPVATNATEKGRKLNRRVEIVIMNP